MAYYVYILRSLKDGRLYTGSTSNVAERFESHNRGSTFSTRNRRPFELVYVEECPDRAAALARERRLKSLEGGSEKYEMVSRVSEAELTALRERYLGE